jgi:hypothetical protein
VHAALDAGARVAPDRVQADQVGDLAVEADAALERRLLADLPGEAQPRVDARLLDLQRVVGQARAGQQREALAEVDGPGRVQRRGRVGLTDAAMLSTPVPPRPACAGTLGARASML